MALNAAIITDTAKEITKQSVVDYGAGVFGHTTQDWGQHNVARVHDVAYVTAAGATIAAQSFRIVATRDDASTLGQTLVLALPINSAGTTAITNSVPIIIQQPANEGAIVGGVAQFQVAAISDITLSYQWQKRNSSVWSNVATQTATTLVLTNVAQADSGSQYRAVVANANGSVVSNAGTLTVTAGLPTGEGNAPFYESLPLFKLLF